MPQRKVRDTGLVAYQPDVKKLGTTLGEALPANDPVARFLIIMSMASNAIALNRRLMVDAYDDGSPSCVYHLQTQLAHLSEAGKALAAERQAHPEIEGFLTSMPSEDQKLLDLVDGLFPTKKKGKDAFAMGQQRGFVFHWPRTSDGLLASVLEDLKDVEMALEFDAATGFLERVHFADDVAYALLDATGPKDASTWVEPAKKVSAAFELFVERALAEYLAAPEN